MQMLSTPSQKYQDNSIARERMNLDDPRATDMNVNLAAGLDTFSGKSCRRHFFRSDRWLILNIDARSSTPQEPMTF